MSIRWASLGFWYVSHGYFSYSGFILQYGDRKASLIYISLLCLCPTYIIVLLTSFFKRSLDFQLTSSWSFISGILLQRHFLLHLSLPSFLYWMCLCSGQYCSATGLYYFCSQWSGKSYTWSSTNMSHLISEKNRWVNLVCIAPSPFFLVASPFKPFVSYMFILCNMFHFVTEV